METPIKDKMIEILTISKSPCRGDYLPTVKIKDEAEYYQIDDFCEYLKHPQMADSGDIQQLMQSLLENGLAFREREIINTATLFKNYIEFLTGKLFIDGLNIIKEDIISKRTWFPSIAEILEHESEFIRRLANTRNITNKALDGFWASASQEVFERIVRHSKAKAEARAELINGDTK